jgi:hypothetical protein
MGDATRIEQRLHDLVASWRRRQDPQRSVTRDSAREMERQAVQRLFADQRPSKAPTHPADLKSAREMERRAIERLYGHRSNVVVRVDVEADDEDA